MTMTLFAPSGTLRSRPTAMCERAVPRVDIIGCVAAVCAENSLHAGCHVAPCYKRDMSARQRRWNSGKQNTVLLRLVSGPGQHLAICPKCLRLSTYSHIVRYMSSKISQDFYIDLLFFHRKLNRLIAIDLKLGKFEAAYKGQMELYLRWLEKYEQEAHEASPLGLILCAGKSSEQIELLRLDQSGIRVAEYLTELPDRRLLEQKLHKTLMFVRHSLETD